jgi:hypothetical protein
VQPFGSPDVRDVMRALVLSLATLATLVLAASAQAAGPWSAPVDVGPPSDYVEAPTLAFSLGGSGLVGWLVRMGGEPGATGGPIQGHNDGYSGRIAPLGSSGAPGRPRTLPDSVAAGPALDRTGRAVVLRTLVLSCDPDCGYRRKRMTWSNVSRNGTVGRAHPLATATLIGPPVLAVDARGDALAAWMEYRPTARQPALAGSYRIRAAWRRAGAAFDRPVTLLVTDALPFPAAVTGAIGRAGRAAVVFADVRETRRVVLAWTHGARDGFSPTRIVGPHQGFTRTAAAVTDRGRVIVAWGTQDAGEEAGRPWIVRAATLAPGSPRFSTAQTLDPGHGVNRPVGQIALAAAPNGRATVAWSAVRRASGTDLAFPVMTATSDAAGRFGRATQLAQVGAVGDVAVRADGAAIVTWATGEVAADSVLTKQAFAAVRTAGARAFGAPEAIADPDVARPPTAAFDPLTGSPTVAWAARPNGVDTSMGLGRTAVLRFATRQAP